MAWLTGWSYRKPYVIDHTQVAGALSNFVALLDISADADIIAGLEDAGGADIRFTTDDGETLCYFDREVWSVSALGIYHVCIPSVSAVVDTTIYVYYGNPGAADGADAANTWATAGGYGAVWHLGEAVGSAVDSTGNGNTGTFQGDLPDVNRGGKIGDGQDLDGSGDYITVADDASHDPGGAMTAECWVWHNSQVSSSSLMMHDFSDYKWMLYSTNDGCQFYVRTASGVSYTALENTGTASWKHVAGVYDRTLGTKRLKLYVDGVEEQSNNGYDEDISAGDEGILLGRWGNNYLNGILDECRYSNVARTANLLATQVANQSAPGSFFSAGAEETQPGGEGGTPFYYNRLLRLRRSA